MNKLTYKFVVEIPAEQYEQLERMSKHGGNSINDYLTYLISIQYGSWLKRDKEWND